MCVVGVQVLAGIEAEKKQSSRHLFSFPISRWLKKMPTDITNQSFLKRSLQEPVCLNKQEEMSAGQAASVSRRSCWRRGVGRRWRENHFLI